MSYRNYIQNIIDTRGQWTIPTDDYGNELYYEMHHIIPACIGGESDRRGRFLKGSHNNNCVYLTLEEHKKAHELLLSEYNDLFDKARLKVADRFMNSRNNEGPWNKGLTGIYTEETLRKIGEASKGRNPWKYVPVDSEGYKLSKETRKKISDSKKGKSIISTTGKARQDKHYYTNGSITKMFNEGDQPDGWVKTNANKADGKKWYNNGKINKFEFECPEGFVPGFINKRWRNK